MTIRDPEILEALFEEPELLAIADAVTETQRQPRRTHRRALSRAGALAAVGAAVLLAVLLWPSGSGRNGILDRALAAIGDGDVLHLVTRLPVGEELVNLRTGKTLVPTYEVESWSDRDSNRIHMIFRRNGEILGEFVFPEDSGSDVHIGTIDPAYAALWSGYRQALATGQAKIEGQGSLDGHSVYWLKFASRGTEVAIDRKTYEPLDFRTSTGSGRHLDSRVLLARTEPFSAAAFTRRTSKPSPFSSVGVGSSGSGVQAAPSTPGSGSSAKPWLQAGPAIAGVKLASVEQTQSITNGEASTGFELAYGPQDGLRRSVIIDESKHAAEPSGSKGIPDGFIRISRGEGSDESGASYPIWTGDLVVDGIYLSIQSGISRDAVLEAARALKPA